MSKIGLGGALWLALLPLVAGCGGCTDTSIVPGPGSTTGGESQAQWQEELFNYAIDNLNRLDQFDAGNLMPQISERLAAMLAEQGKPAAGRADTLVQTCPQPEILSQIVGRLNQWVRSQGPPADWKPDPLLTTLPERLRELAVLQNLAKLEFSAYDGLALQEAVWLRDVSRWAGGDDLDELNRVRALFDWTIRNVQLDLDRPARVPQMPWEVLLLGRGTAIERAWVFILLARQQGIDAALLTLPADKDEGRLAAVGTTANEKEKPAAGAKKTARPWAVAVLIEGQLYLFDAALGLPLPAPQGIKLDGKGQLDIRPATLAQAAADDAVLRQLDADEARRYPARAADFQRVVLFVEGSPACLAARMRLLESRLAGKQKVVLTAAPAVQAQRFRKALGPGGEVQLWQFPFEVWHRRINLRPKEVEQRLAALLPLVVGPSAPLYKGRILHLKGQLSGPDGAQSFYQIARISNSDLASLPVHDGEKFVIFHAKQTASYWLGLIAFERANYASAVDYFIRRTLEAAPNGQWTHGAKYNLARTFEVSGEREKAIELYRADATSPAYQGHLLRAKWLTQLTQQPAGKE